MVTVSTREQARALRDELDVRIAGEVFPADLEITKSVPGWLFISSVEQDWFRYIDEAGEVRG